MTIHRRYRVCRRHFDSNCLNGGCRRLLNTAVPTLHLEPEMDNVRIDDSGNLTVSPNVVYLSVAKEPNEMDEHIELIVPEEENRLIDMQNVKSQYRINYHFMAKRTITLILNAISFAVKRKSDEIGHVSPVKASGNKYGYLNEIHTKHKIKRQKLECDQPSVAISMYCVVDKCV